MIKKYKLYLDSFKPKDHQIDWYDGPINRLHVYQYLEYHLEEVNSLLLACNNSMYDSNMEKHILESARKILSDRCISELINRAIEMTDALNRVDIDKVEYNLTSILDDLSLYKSKEHYYVVKCFYAEFYNSNETYYFTDKNKFIKRVIWNYVRNLITFSNGVITSLNSENDMCNFKYYLGRFNPTILIVFRNRNISEDNKVSIKRIEAAIDKNIHTLVKGVDYKRLVWDASRGKRRFDDDVCLDEYNFRIILN